MTQAVTKRNEARGIVAESGPDRAGPRAWLGPSMIGYESDGDSSDVSCEWDGCDDTFDTVRGMKSHHAIVHGESIAGVLVECDQCGEMSRMQAAFQQRSEHNFCDAECYGEWQSENCHGEQGRRWDDGKTPIQCAQCGEEKLIWEHRDGQNDRQFCDDDCYKEWLSGNRVGENHHSWKGGHFPYGSGWTDTLKERIRERQGRKCADCGTHESDLDRKLDVHHIQKARNVSDAQNRNDESNLVALCRPCHTQWELMAPLRPQTPNLD